MNYPNDSIRVKFAVSDQRGVLWIGSNQGLLRCDQEEATLVLQMTNLNCATRVDSLLWLGTNTGTVRIFDPVRLEPVRSFDLSDPVSISAIDSYDEKICISTQGGGIILINETDTLRYGSDTGLTDAFAYQTDFYQNLIIAATDNGLNLYDPGKSGSIRNLETSITRAIAVQDSMLWIGSYKNGLMRLNLAQPSAKPVIVREDFKVSKLIAQNDRVFGLSSEGVVEFSSKTPHKPKVILKNSGIIDFILLREDLLFGLSEDGNILIADLHLYEVAESIHENITAVTTNSQWLFSGGKGMVCARDYQTGNCEREYRLESDDVIVSMAANERRIFVGTFNNGIYVFDLLSGKSTQINTSNGLPDNSVLSLSIRNDTLWLTTLSGISCIDPNLEVSQPRAGRSLESTYLYSILSLDSAIFIGTDGHGGFLLQDTVLVRLNFMQSLSDETIYHISRDEQGNVWFTTKNHGLCRFEVSTGALDKNLGQSDGVGYIMASGGFGKSALLVGQGQIQLFWGRQSVLLNDPERFRGIKGDYSNAICSGTKGGFYFASGPKLYTYHPDTLLRFPGVYLSSVHANLSAVGRGRMQFDSDINHLAFQFEPIWYQNTDNVKFRYRLSGVESAWNETTGRDAVYPNLKYGSYTFQVQAGLGDQYYPKTLCSYSFTIAKPFYLQWWFILIIIVSILALAYVILQWQVARTQRKWQSDKKRVESELAVLRNQVNPHFLFNSLNTLLNLIETQPAEAEEYLQRLSDFYRKIIENQDNHILKLHEELRNLKEYIYLQKKRFGSALNLEINLSNEFLDTQIPALTFQLLAENAIKHNVVSQSQPLVIRIYSDKNKIVFSNLKNLLTQHPGGTGMGLENIQTRYLALYKAQVEIVETEIEFSVKLPIIP